MTGEWDYRTETENKFSLYNFNTVFYFFHAFILHIYECLAVKNNKDCIF